MSRTSYDLIVLGSGPAGEKGAAVAAYFGKKVALVERLLPLVGGACTNTGTLPSKTMRESALALTGMMSRGLEAAVLAMPKPYSGATLLFREHLVVESERRRIRKNLEREGIDVFAGIGSFVDAHTVQVKPPDGSEALALKGEVILVATGTRPYRPPFIPFEAVEVYDSDEILAIETIPEPMIVLGSGVIASEYACIFAALGVKVTMMDGRERLLEFLDQEMGDRFAAELLRLGLTLRLGDAPASCTVDEKTRLCAVGTKSGRTETAQAVVASSGRSGNVEDLNLAAIGIAPDKRGNIAVDEHFRTAVPNVLAAGDVIGFPGPASTSMEQGRLAVCHAFGFAHQQRRAPILPYGIYTIPELSYVGASEEELRKRGIDYVVGQAFMRDNGRGRILGAESGVLKLIVAPDRKILGVHILGPSATELIHVGAMAMTQGATIDLFVDAVFNYPTLSELYKYAAYDAHAALQRRSVSW